jgi:outer membrane protein W
MKRTISTGFIFVLLMAAGSVLSAADSNWIVRGQYVKTWPSTDSYQTESVIGDLPPIFSSFSVDSGQGFGLDIEYKFNKRIGIVLSAIFTDMEGTFVYGFEPGEENRFSSDPNTVDFYTINGGMNYHFSPDAVVDFYLGAFAGVFSYDSVTFTLPEIDRQFKINFDDQFSYGLNAGLDIPFGDSPFMATLAVKYLISDLKEDGGPREIAIDPLIGSIGIGFRF